MTTPLPLDMLHTAARSVCVLLPVLNEEHCIERLLEEINTNLAGENAVTCVVDDGSRDRTVDLVNVYRAQAPARVHLIQRVKTSRGSERGGALHAALLWGLEHTDADVFVEMDGDLSHRPEELPAGIALVRGECDVAIASKYIVGSRVINRPLGRRLVSRLCSIMVRSVISPLVHDYSNGYRFYNRAAAQMIAETQIRYASPIYLTEVLSVWLSRGARIAEFPTTYVGRGKGESKLRLTDLAKAALAIFEIAGRLHVFGYGASTRPIPAQTRPDTGMHV